MQDDIAALRGDTRALRRDLDALRAQEGEHTQETLKKIEELSSALQEFNHSSRMTDADFGTQLDHMIRDVQELRGAVEVNEHRIGETETKLEQTLAQKIAELKTQGGSDGGENSAAAEEAMPKDKKEALAYAAKLTKEDKDNDARAVYRQIMKTWPKDSGVTDEAMYRLGESYYDDKKYDAGLREYIKIVDKFGTGPLVDDAYYKIALCSIELGRLEDAQTFLTELVTNHKKSPLLKTAKAKLDEVNKRVEQSKMKAHKKGSGKPGR